MLTLPCLASLKPCPRGQGALSPLRLGITPFQTVFLGCGSVGARDGD